MATLSSILKNKKKGLGATKLELITFFNKTQHRRVEIELRLRWAYDKEDMGGWI